MTCREVNALLADHLVGELASDVRQPFEAHLLRCRCCLAYLRGYRATIRLVRATGRDASRGSTMPEDLVHAILERRRALA